MTPVLTSAALGDTSILPVLSLVLFAQDRSCLQEHNHVHFSAHSTPAYLQYSCVSSHRSNTSDAFIFHAFNPISQWGSWREQCRDQCSGDHLEASTSVTPVQDQCPVNWIFFISSSMKLKHFLQETVPPDLLTSPTSRTWSFEVELYSECNKEHPGF